MTTPATDQPGLVVVGGGAGAHACAGAYWDAGGEWPVTIVSDDDRPPYFRPALTKELVTGEQTSADLPLEADEWYAERNVTVRLGCRAFGFDHTDRVLATDAGPVPYGALVLATGSSASTLPVPGADVPQILRLRHAVDTERLLERVDAGGDVLVIGSGFIGCEVAASLRRRGTAVTMATMEAAPQADRLGTEVGGILAGWLADAGVAFHGGVTLDRIEHGSAGSTAVFADRRIEATHVILATGARPNLDVARAGGLAGDTGVDVDARMATALDGVMAIGDIAHALHPVAGRRLRVEHWGDAEGMGKVAGTVAAGGAGEWRDVPGFWSQIGERDELKYVAWGDGYDECVLRRSDDGGFTAWYAKNGVTCGVLTHRHDEDNQAAAELISSFAPLPVGR
jgi:3-phenylpropionate/trans-cinnamate dioxygenase ferredoxin reductase component